MTEVHESLAAQAGLMSELMSISLQPTLKRIGISYVVFELLSAVQSAGANVSQAEIARRMGITPPTLSEAIVSAIKNGLIEQATHPNDARSKILKLTPRSVSILKDVLSHLAECESMMVVDIPAHDLALTLSVLKKANLRLAKQLQTNLE